jgi:hypothetical protein
MNGAGTLGREKLAADLHGGKVWGRSPGQIHGLCECRHIQGGDQATPRIIHDIPGMKN